MGSLFSGAGFTPGENVKSANRGGASGKTAALGRQQILKRQVTPWNPKLKV
jgi:hypothetical protein